MNSTRNSITKTSKTFVINKHIKLENTISPHIKTFDLVSSLLTEGKKIHVTSTDNVKNVTVNNNDDDSLVLEKTSVKHGFVAAVLHAYNNHQHLSLTPDDIWLTIAQGVSDHININAEKLRYEFVNHKGKKALAVKVGDIMCFGRRKGTLRGDWGKVIDRLAKLVDSNLKKKEIKKLLECDFSTSTPSSITVSRIVLLDAFKSYFSYRMHILCGIPKVTLEGTLEDWLKLQEKFLKIRKLNLDLDFWLDRLEPVISKLVETYKGNVDEKFWNQIATYKYYTLYGLGGFEKIDQNPNALKRVSGWITTFFPYTDENVKITGDQIELYEFPEGRVKVPFTTDVIEAQNLKFIGGFMGAKQKLINDEAVVSPVIGWAVVDY